jgi:hypothetical protein
MTNGESQKTIAKFETQAELTRAGTTQTCHQQTRQRSFTSDQHKLLCNTIPVVCCVQDVTWSLNVQKSGGLVGNWDACANSMDTLSASKTLVVTCDMQCQLRAAAVIAVHAH